MERSTAAVTRPQPWVGRESELAAFHRAIDDLHRGVGGVIWVEGEAGIGKSALVACGGEAARQRGCELLWGTGDQLGSRLPLRLMFECLQVRHGSPDPRRAAVADLVFARRPHLLSEDDDTHAVAAELLLDLVEEVSAAAATILVLDDLHWADDTSLMVVQRLVLAAVNLPVLLVVSTRPQSRRPQLQHLRSTVRRQGGKTLRLGPLPPESVDELLRGRFGVPPGPVLAALAAQATGNPLFLRELLDALAREGSVHLVDGHAEVPEQVAADVPGTLVEVVGSRLGDVSADVVDLLRLTALLGADFAVTDVAAVAGRPVRELTVDLQQAVAAGIIVPRGTRMTFRHPLIRQVLYDGTPAAVRLGLHRDAARALAADSADPARVAQQLLAADRPGDPWSRRWLVGAAKELACRAPAIAADLLRRELDVEPVAAVGEADDRVSLLIALTRTLVGLGEPEEAEQRARQALLAAHEPDDRGYLSWLLARAQFSGRRNDAAITTLGEALASPDLPAIWRGRLLASLSMIQRAHAGRLDLAEETAREALAAAGAAGDPFAASHALTGLGLIHSVRRDHDAALVSLENALQVLTVGPEYDDLRSLAQHARIFTLQNLSRWADAQASLQEVRASDRRHGRREGALSGITAAVLMFWQGRWDDALAELGFADHRSAAASYRGLRESGPALLCHGVAALIAARGHERARAARHLRIGLQLPLDTVADRENRDFLVVARAILAEQDGNPRQALSYLAELLERRTGEMTLTHQWLPDLTRLALDLDDQEALSTVLDTARAEAAAERSPARAAAALDRCLGLAGADQAQLERAVSHYREHGVTVELAGALEDLAVVAARSDQAVKSRRLLGEAVELFTGIGAHWDVRRSQARLRRLGIRRGVHGSRPARPRHGWHALTPTEQRVALLVAEGRSTADISH
ncbi:MAG TPA: AAA family ATPase, partial [Actinoplanes sp.]|nr:AAA family ATPase [Actinoplanes sp.]